MQAKHIKGTISLCAALLAGVALVAASGAGAAKPRAVTKIDVSTKAAVVHYLRSIHVNPKGVVIQRGARNYAGPNCPGKRWTCASTKHTVVQIAKRGGQNRFVCKSSKCVAVQISGTSHGFYVSGRRLASTAAPNKGGNSGVCVKTGSGATTGTGQTCTINQSGSGLNKAGVYENTQKVSGLTQNAQYNATITQTSSGAGNTACVFQNIYLDGSTSNTNGKPTTVSLQAFQTITIRQDSLTGTNSATNAADSTGACDTATLTQSQTLTSTVTATGSITQNQDTATTNMQGIPAANVVTDIEQNQGDAFKGSASGLNNAVFTQTTNQVAIANTPRGTVIQQQNANVPAQPYSGIVGTINQDSSEKSTAVVTQTETQCEDAVNQTLPTPAPGNPPACPVVGDAGVPSGVTLTQKQYGPEGVFTAPKHSAGRVPFAHKGYGASTQTGAATGVDDSFKLTQTSTQNADQTSGQSNIIQGDCQSDGGSCEAGQKATLNGQDTNDGYTAGTISQLIINCTNGHASCTATPPPAPTITSHPTNPSESTSPAFEWSEAATAGVSFDCSIDSGDPAPCSSGDTFPVGLGDHTFEVTASDNFGNTSDPDSFNWTVVPFLTFEATDDGASAGWSDTPGASPIKLIVGNNSGTYAQFTLHNFEGIAIGDLSAEPTFTTDTFLGGAPRYEIDLDNGDYLFGYPSNAPYGRSWDLNCGHVPCTPMAQVPWNDVKAAESTATMTDVLVEADFPPGVNATYNISDFSFDGYNLSFFGNHWH
jgi:hypothetical protein